jgi:hypothetical protein
MRHLRWAVPVALVLALCTSLPAAAHDRHGGGGAIIAPSGAGELADWFKTFIELPTPANPLLGDGEDPCVRLGPRGKVLVAITFGQVVTCTAELGTVVNTGAGHFCSTFDPPDSPFYAVGPREQRRCARAVSHETGMRVSVDGGPWVDLFQPQFTAYTPPTIVRLPVDNAFGVPAQKGIITGYGWHANIRNLRVGRHVYTTEVDVDGATHAFHHVVNIVPRTHSDDD